MDIRNKIRIMRYGLGVIILMFAIFIGILMDNFILLFGNLNGIIQMVLIYLLIVFFVFFFVLSIILIGRCEIFLNENYPKNKKITK